jgi:hypothetical protein
MPFTSDQIKTLNEVLPPQSAEHLIECCVYLENDGFTPEQLLRVAKTGGNQAIEVLKDLILIHISDEQILIDEETGLPWTHLSTLLYAGFSREQLIAVLSHSGGSKNLYALLDLLQFVPLNESPPTTQLQLLVSAGFSTAHVTSDSCNRIILAIKITTGAIHDSVPYLEQLDYVKQTVLGSLSEAIVDRAY